MSVCTFFGHRYTGRAIMPRLTDALTKTPPKYAIDKRNRWMISVSDYVVCYCEHNADFGAPRYMNMARKKGLTVINLYSK